MSRVHRPQMPGVAFHVTARTQGRHPYFDERLRDDVAQYIRDGLASSDAHLLAHAVMPNHFHIVLRQGTRPLGWIMQPIMRRTSLLMQRAHGLKGHTFERRFRSHACSNADHLRRAITYTHLNPIRAGLCKHTYAWSSARLFERNSHPGDCAVAVTFALRLFALGARDTEEEMRDNYARFVVWRVLKDEHDAAGTICSAPEPQFAAGDAYFARTFCALPRPDGVIRRDLRDSAIDLLRRSSVDVSLDELRVQRLPRSLTNLRRKLIAGLLELRHPGRDIANFFRISDTAVSRIAIEIRYSKMGQSLK
jgi:REP element-mobilizing transposase RayT